MTKIILLNGPPRSGKDFAGDLLRDETEDGAIVKFAQILKERTHAFYDLCNPLTGKPYAHDRYEDCKDEPNDDFEGLTPREAYIAISEQYVKPVHGEKQFGIWLADEMRCYDDAHFSPLIVTDSGFRPEAEVLVEEFGAENIVLARIHREGCTFEGDARSYIDLADLGVRCVDVPNPGTPDEFLKLLQDLVLNPDSIQS